MWHSTFDEAARLLETTVYAPRSWRTGSMMSLVIRGLAVQCGGLELVVALFFISFFLS
jgi:hypothetical protein